MAKAPKRPTGVRGKSLVQSMREASDAATLVADKIAAATTMDPQTGMDIVHPEKPTKAALEAKKAETAKQFAEADQKGGPTTEDIEHATLVRSVRGW